MARWVAGMFERGCFGRGWQGKVLKGKGAFEGCEFLQGFWSVWAIFVWRVEGGEILVSNSNGL